MVWLSIAFGVFLVWLVVVVLFTPAINYHLSHRTSVHDAGFLYAIQSTCQAMPHHGNRVEIFTNGPEFYPAMLEAIRGATQSVIMELYIFQPGKIADQFVAALSDRARHGVNVTIVVDAIGSLSLRGRPVRRLRKAGCRIESYQQLRWYSLARLNNRTHRELLIVDGRIAFAGGAGIADWWAIGRQARAPVARYDGANRRAGRRRPAGRGRRELAGVLRRDPDRPGIFSRARGERRDDGVRRQELAL